MNDSRRNFLKSILGAAAGAALISDTVAEPASFKRVKGLDKMTTVKRPNIIYINSHDTGRFTSPYGHRAATPNLHQLAMDGVCFTQAHCAAPTCSPSRASLVTGQCPHSNGMLGLAHRGFALKNYGHHLLHTLRKEAGYNTHLIGLQHIARDKTIIGYDSISETVSNHVKDVAPAAISYLKNYSNSAPFYLEIGFQETHREFIKATKDDDSRYTENPSPLPNVKEVRDDLADFNATLRVLDKGVGDILAALDEQGLAENTLIISTTDHGIAFPMMKCNLYDTGTGIHLVMRGPGGFFGGKVCDALISQIDIFPTLCDLLEIPNPEWLEGKSFLPIIKGKPEAINNEIFAEVNFHASYEPVRALRTSKWKYISRFGDNLNQVFPNCDDSPSKLYWLKNGWANHKHLPEELYDLTFDPNERNNLVSDSKYFSILSDMRARLKSWMVKTNDPLLNGPVKPPKGVAITPADKLSPTDKAFIYEG